MKDLVHVLAIVATLFAVVASALQAHRALKKKWERTQQKERASQRPAVPGGPSWTQFEKDLQFDIHHLGHVALLWGVIMLSAVFSLAAEVIDFCIDR